MFKREVLCYGSVEDLLESEGPELGLEGQAGNRWKGPEILRILEFILRAVGSH